MIAKSTIKHDGVTYQAGEEVLGLSQEQEQVLVEAGVLEVPEVKPGKTATKKPAGKKPAKVEDESGEEVEETPLASWSKARLMEYATANKIELDPTFNRDEMFAVIAKTL